MKPVNYVTAFLLALSVLLPHTGRADTPGNLGQVNEDNAAETYEYICVPGTEQGLEGEDLERVKKGREQYHAFLDNPRPQIEQMLNSALVDKSKDKTTPLGEQLRLVFLWAGTCEATFAMIDYLKEGKGCMGHSHEAALQGCREVWGKMHP